MSIIDLTETSFSASRNSVNSVIVVELDDNGRWFNTQDTGLRQRTSRSSRPHNQNERIIHPKILNEIPIEVTDSPINVKVSSVRREVASTSNKKNQVKERDNSLKSARERSPLGGSLGVCPICLESLGKQPLASTKCGHVFCQMCLTNALKRVKKCPTCRKPLIGNTAFHPLFLNRE